MRRSMIAPALALAMAAAPLGEARAFDLVTTDSALGPITISRALAPKIVPLIAELKALGLHARVKCFAATRGGHVRGSLHLSGDACDFLPLTKAARGRNRMPTPALMFTRRAADLIAAAGLRNGCSFNDCGHIDNGRPVTRPRVADR